MNRLVEKILYHFSKAILKIIYISNYFLFGIQNPFKMSNYFLFSF